MGRSMWIWGVLLAVAVGWSCAPGLVPVAASQSTESIPLGLPAQEMSPLGGPAGPGGAQAATGLGDTLGALAMVVGLVVVLAAVYRWIVAKSGGLQGQLGTARSPAGLIDVMARYPIGRGQSLLLLRLDRRLLLVSQTAGSRVGSAPTLRTLCEVDDPDEVAALIAKAAPNGERFDESFARASRRPVPGAEPAAGSSVAGVEVVDLTRGSGFVGRLSGLVGGRS